MNVEQLRAELARWTYRPGWKFEIQAGMTCGLDQMFILHVTYEAADSRAPWKTTLIKSSHPGFAEEIEMMGFAAWLQRIMFKVERHESREWLWRDGEIFDDPHKEADR